MARAARARVARGPRGRGADRGQRRRPGRLAARGRRLRRLARGTEPQLPLAATPGAAPAERGRRHLPAALGARGDRRRATGPCAAPPHAPRTEGRLGRAGRSKPADARRRGRGAGPRRTPVDLAGGRPGGSRGGIALRRRRWQGRLLERRLRRRLGAQQARSAGPHRSGRGGHPTRPARARPRSGRPALQGTAGRPPPRAGLGLPAPARRALPANGHAAGPLRPARPPPAVLSEEQRARIRRVLRRPRSPRAS